MLKKPRLDIASTAHVATTPNSLFKLAVHYIAQHLELVESFMGFPEIVGELIFRAAEHSCRFDYEEDEYHKCLRRLILFTEAYGEVVLSKLSLSGRWSSFQLYKSHIEIFRDLTELELAECGLEDEDDVLPHIGQYLLKLTYLSLRQNKLTDKGLMRLTTPYRVMGTGPGKLVQLNISDNQDITASGIKKYMSGFRELNEINITGTSVKRTEALLKIWKFEVRKGSSTGPEVVSFGWASGVVSKWAVQAEQSLMSLNNQKTSAQRFYSEKRKNDDKNLKLRGTFKQTVSGYNLILSRIIEGAVAAEKESADFNISQRSNRFRQHGPGTVLQSAACGYCISDL